MVWSYSGDPGSSDKDAVRFHVQDVISIDPQVNDEEIEFLLTEENNDVLRAAARTAEVIAAKYARQVDKSLGGYSLSAGRRQEKYERLAAKLWARAGAVGVGLATPFAGGISGTQKKVAEADTDRVLPAFTRQMQEFEHVPPLTSKSEQ